MKLNGLTNNLKGNDQSLSNSYLQHIVELLRKELDSLTERFNILDAEATEHIETQKTVVETVTVKAEDINGKIKFLSNAIEMFGTTKLNGHNIITDETFQGPFTYKGEVNTLPETANAGDVYIYDGKVSIYNGASYDSFIIPLGVVAKNEYDADQLKVNQSISENKSDINILKEDTLQLATNVGVEISNINTALENTVAKNPADNKVYVRKNNEWIEQSAANNTVKSVAGESSISNEETGVTINAPKVEINSSDIKVNGTTLTQADKFSLSTTNKSDDTVTYYELQYKRKPFSSYSSDVYGYTVYSEGNVGKSNIKSTHNAKWNVTTRDYQYRKTFDNAKMIEGSSTYLTSMDKYGNIKPMYFPARQLIDRPCRNYITDWMVWNQDFCPEGFENKAYLFLTNAYGTPNAATLLEYDNGDFVRSYDMTKQITDQGGTLPSDWPGNWDYIGSGGKSLRNKNIQRFCWIAYDVNDSGGTYAIIIGGDKNSNIYDTFDPSKCIYVKLPATAYPGYTSMAATDKAWYLTEDKTGRIMRITPNGRVTEYNLSKTTYRASVGTYIEYTDKNGKPACAFRVWDDNTNGKEAICFFEEKEDGGVSFEEVDMSPYVYGGWDSSLWRMTENDYYIFFTAGFGFSVNDDNGFPTSATLKKLWYWDKKTHTTHVIDDLYGFPDTWDNGSHLQMYKTREKAIWIAPHVATLAKANRTGEFKYILNRDYTNINPETGVDEGNIEVQTAAIGANHPWFTCNSTTGWNTKPISLFTYDNTTYTTIYQQYACVNDDGIGFLMSPDYKAFALFYGEGNIKVYEISNVDSKAYDYDPNVQQMCPAKLEDVNEYLSSCEGLKHGWMISGYANKLALGYDNMANSNGFRVYIGIHYKNGEPTILERPTITTLVNQTLNLPAKHMFEYYSYLLTYDDYERRRKLMRGIFMNISYGTVTKGIDSYYEEVEHNATRKINLEYDGKVISSIEE